MTLQLNSVITVNHSNLLYQVTDTGTEGSGYFHARLLSCRGIGEEHKVRIATGEDTLISYQYGYPVVRKNFLQFCQAHRLTVNYDLVSTLPGYEGVSWYTSRYWLWLHPQYDMPWYNVRIYAPCPFCGDNIKVIDLQPEGKQTRCLCGHSYVVVSMADTATLRARGMHARKK